VLEPQSSTEQKADPSVRLTVAAGHGAPPVHSARPTDLEHTHSSLATPLTSVATPALSEPGPTALTSTSSSAKSIPSPPDPQSEPTTSRRPQLTSSGQGAAATSPVVGANPSVRTPPVLSSEQLSAAQSAAGSSTPMIDAAIHRVETLTRQQRESLSSAEEPEKQPARPLAGSTSLHPAKTAESDSSLPVVLARTGESHGSMAATNRAGASTSELRSRPSVSTDASGKRGDPPSARSLASPTASLVHHLPETQTPRGDEHGPPADLPPGKPGPLAAKRESSRKPGAALHVAGEIAPPGPARVESRPLDVANLQLCRKVNGFGSCEPLAETDVRPGQPVRLYCEMTGLRYEAVASGFVSRLSSRVEVRLADSDTVVWEQELGIARDECPRVRHDYYVSYKLTFPPSLQARTYRLCLVQTDLAANRSASAEIRLTLAP
jgi:hypothetical protein